MGEIVFPVNTEKSEKLTIRVNLNGTEYQNNWPVWIYPAENNWLSYKVVFTQSLEEALTALNKGAKVLFNLDYNKLEGIEGRFVPVFWSPVHFPNQPSTRGS